MRLGEELDLDIPDAGTRAMTSFLTLVTLKGRKYRQKRKPIDTPLGAKFVYDVGGTEGIQD